MRKHLPSLAQGFIAALVVVPILSAVMWSAVVLWPGLGTDRMPEPLPPTTTLPETPPASLVPVPDPEQSIIDVVCTDYGPPAPPPPLECFTGELEEPGEHLPHQGDWNDIGAQP